jgi:hypothetical protein
LNATTSKAAANDLSVSAVAWHDKPRPVEAVSASYADRRAVAENRFVWQIIWSANSLSHVAGNRNFATNDDNRNDVPSRSSPLAKEANHADRAAAIAAICWQFGSFYRAMSGLALP